MIIVLPHSQSIDNVTFFWRRSSNNVQSLKAFVQCFCSHLPAIISKCAQSSVKQSCHLYVISLICDIYLARCMLTKSTFFMGSPVGISQRKKRLQLLIRLSKLSTAFIKIHAVHGHCKWFEPLWTQFGCCDLPGESSLQAGCREWLSVTVLTLKMATACPGTAVETSVTHNSLPEDSLTRKVTTTKTAFYYCSILIGWASTYRSLETKGT